MSKAATVKPRAAADQKARLVTEMPVTKDFRETVRARAQRDRGFREAILIGAIDCFLSDEVATGKILLRNYVHSTVGFDELANATNKSCKSLMRMLRPSCNPQANILFAVLDYLQRRGNIKLELMTSARSSGKR